MSEQGEVEVPGAGNAPQSPDTPDVVTDAPAPDVSPDTEPPNGDDVVDDDDGA